MQNFESKVTQPSTQETNWRTAIDLITAAQLIPGSAPYVTRHISESSTLYFGNEMNALVRRNELKLFQNGEPVVVQEQEISAFRAINADIDEREVVILLHTTIDGDQTLLQILNNRGAFLMFDPQTRQVLTVELEVQTEQIRTPAGLYAKTKDGRRMQVTMHNLRSYQPQVTIYAANDLFDTAIAYAQSLQPRQVEQLLPVYIPASTYKPREIPEPKLDATTHFVTQFVTKFGGYCSEVAQSGRDISALIPQASETGMSVAFLLDDSQTAIIPVLEQLFLDAKPALSHGSAQSNEQVEFTIRDHAVADAVQRLLLGFFSNFSTMFTHYLDQQFAALPQYISTHNLRQHTLKMSITKDAVHSLVLFELQQTN